MDHLSIASSITKVFAVKSGSHKEQAKVDSFRYPIFEDVRRTGPKFLWQSASAIYSLPFGKVLFTWLHVWSLAMKQNAEFMEGG